MGLNSGTRLEPIYGPNTRCGLRNIPVFLYHLPDDVAFIEELVSSRDVRVIIIRQDVNPIAFVAGRSKHKSGNWGRLNNPAIYNMIKDFLQEIYIADA
jgi:hypothetical protein